MNSRTSVFLLICWLAAATSLPAADTLLSPVAGPTLPSGNLVQHFRAEDFGGLGFTNGQTINVAWPDAAPLNGAQNANPFSSPAYNTTGAFPTVRFNGTSNGFRATAAPGIGATSGFAYFAVLRTDAGGFSNGTTGNGSGTYFLDRDTGVDSDPLVSLKAVGGNFGHQTRYDNGSGLGGPVSTTSISTSEFQIVTMRRNTTTGEFEVWVDGALEGTTVDNGMALTPQPVVIGNHNGQSQGFTGDLAALLIFNDELSDADFNDVGTYLEFTFGLDTAFPNFTPPALTPEPSSFALFGLIAATLVGGRWWRRRAA